MSGIPFRTTSPLRTLTAQGAATVLSNEFEIVQMGRFEDVIFVSNAVETPGGGGDLTTTIQDSPDGVTWGTLVAIAAHSSTGVLTAVLTRAPLRFLRSSSVVAAGGDVWAAQIDVTGPIGLVGV